MTVNSILQSLPRYYLKGLKPNVAAKMNRSTFARKGHTEFIFGYYNINYKWKVFYIEIQGE